MVGGRFVVVTMCHLHEKAEEALGAIAEPFTVDFWISRNENDICDVLSKKVLLDMGIKFKIQPIK